MSRPSRFGIPLVFLLSLAWALFMPAARAQVAGQNVNMVSGTSWPGGDPFLQRQNEPSMAVSTRNPMHILAGANDYRTVDLELALSEGAETGDSWLGLFKSFDGGLTWRSTLLPGCKYADPQCVDNGALHGIYDAGSDPVVRAGTNGMFFYAGLAFDRSTSSTSASAVSSIFVARFNDLNNNENADPITYIDTHIVANGNAAQFLDKPAMAVDIPRSGAATCSFTAKEPGINGATVSVPESFPAGNVYLTYTDFLQGTKANSTPTHLMFTRSTDCGVTWSTPVQLNTGTTTSQGSAIAVNASNGNVYVVWRQFASTGIKDAIMVAQSTNAGKTFSAPVQISTFQPFDQGTTGTAIRTNAYPSITTDNFGFVYVAFSARNLVPSGDARVVAAGSIDGTHWTPAIMVDNPSTNAQSDPSGRGHQIMPAISFANGRLTILYYDLRLDHYQDNYTSAPTSPTGYTATLTPEGELAPPANPSKVFNANLDDAGLTLRRHTIDLRVLELGIFPTITLGPSMLVSQYAYGCCVNPGLPDIEQFKFNVPNLPIFDSGEEPFLGDYIDVVPSPAFVPSGSSWAYNFTPSVNPQFHATWTDNRDVVPPADGNWTHYTPPVPAGTISVFQPGKALTCTPGQEGMRNQNIYTAQITGGLVVGAPGNAKPLGNTTFNGKSVPFQRAFPVEAQNSTSAPLNVRFTIANQPTGGKASFQQFTQTTTLDVTIPAFSSVSRSVFMTSTSAEATVTVNVVQIGSIGGSPTTNGLSSMAVLNPDVTNPNITNPNVTNPNITNPNITNYEVTNPNVTNPNITNPNVTNPNITNPNITNPNVTNPNITNPNVTNVSATNPNVTNPNITNPNITNPNITNPNITNPNITNGAIQDVIYPITNNGNTDATYTVQVAEGQTPPAGVLLQLILDKIYQTPVAISCQLTTETHYNIVANIVNPKLYSPTDPALGTPNITNSTPNEATITLAPGETGYIDFRVFSPTKTPINPLAYFVPVTTPHAVNTQTALANPGVTVAPPVTVPPLIISTASLPDGVLTHVYSAQLVAQGGNPSADTWSVSTGVLPGGLNLNATTGAISGTPAAAGIFTFSIQLKDTAIGSKFPQHTTTQAFTVHVSAPLALTPGTGVLMGGTQGTTYSTTIVPTGGVAPYTISLITGNVPAGLTFNNGAITGNPTGTGLSSFTVQAKDSSNPAQVTTQAFSINIVASGPAFGSIAFVAQPQNSSGGQLISGSPLTVQVFDDTHAVIPNVSVTMSFNGTPPCSTAVLSGTLQRTTDGTGTATFNDLSVDRGQIGYTLQAAVTSTPTIKTASNAFTVNGFCPTANLSVAREYLTSTLLKNGMVLVAGGLNTAESNIADLYNPATGTSAATGTLKAARYQHTATLLNDGTVLLVGGRNSAGWVATAELFNPANGTFTNTTSNPVSPRSAHTATLLADGTVLITGGFYNSAAQTSAEIYNPANQTFTAVSQMHVAQMNHTATLMANGSVLVAGGLDSTAEIYDPVAQTFTYTGSLSTTRSFPSATLLSNGKVLVAGGLNGNAGIGTAELYDPTAGTFALTTGALNTPRGDHTATLLADGTVLLAGGYNNVPPSTASVLASDEIYNPATSTFSNTGTLLTARWQSTATILNDGTVLTAGGFGSSSSLASAERFYSTSPLAPLVLTTPNVTVIANKPVNQFLLEQGGVGPLTWSHQGGTLPAGITFNSTNGLFTGTTASTGSFPLTITITDSSTPAKSVVTAVMLNVIAPLVVTTTTLPNGAVGTPYSAVISTAGGTAPISFSITQANFPPGLTITQPPTGSTSDTLAGTPTTQGVYTFFEAVSDSAHPMQTAMQSYSVTIGAAAPPPAVMTFTTEPGNETTNQNLPTFVVHLAEGGAPVSGATVSLTLNGTGCSSANLAGTTNTMTDGNGNATFNSAFIDRGGPGYTLMATSTSPAATVTSTAFNVPGFCATTPLNTPRDGQVSVNFGNGSVLMVGGYNTITNAFVTPGEIYTPGSGFTTTAGHLNTGRTNLTATLLTSGPNAGSVLIAGGVIDANNDGTNSVELFNPSTGQFTVGAHTMSTARSNHTATALPNGDVLIAGGASSPAPPSGDLNTAEIYHAADGTFSAAITMTGPHNGPTATLLPNGKVLVAGGFMYINSGGGFIQVPTGVAELFDPATNQFTATGQLNTARAEDIAVLLPNGTVLVAAGTNSSNTLEGTGEIYDPNTGVFTYTSQSMTPTINPSAVVLATGKVLITGGQSQASPESSQAQLYDYASQNFTIIQPMVDGRKFFPLSVLNDGTTLVAGGFGASGSFVNSELYYPDASTGIQITSPHTLPTALVGTPYTLSLQEQGGIGPLTWTSASAPPGFSLSPSGVLTGTASSATTYDVPAKVTDSSTPAQTASTTLSLPVVNPLSITTTILPDAPSTNGSPQYPYSAQIQTAGGAGGATTYSIIAGSLPPAITLNSSTGQLSSSAVMPEVSQPTAYQFTVQAASAGPPSSSATQALTIKEVPFFTTQTDNTLPSGTVGTAYSTQFNSTGGVTPYTYQYQSGTIPPGLTYSTLSPTVAQLTGTPTAMGTFTFETLASDSTSPAQAYYETFTITIGAAGPGPVAHLSFSNQPAQSIDDAPIFGQSPSGSSVQVLATDASSVPVPNATITMGFGTKPCNGAMLETSPAPSAVTDGTGTATFYSLRTYTSGDNGYTLVASSNGVTATSNTYNVTGYCSTATPHAAHASGATVGLASGAPGNGKVLVTGGQDSTSGAPIVTTAEIYDPTAGTFTLTTSPMNVQRSGHRATLLNDGTVLITGGISQATPPTIYTNTAEIYNPATGTFTAVGNMAQARANHVAVLLATGQVLIAGGQNGSGTLTETELYDPPSQQFLFNDGVLNSPRTDATATLLPSGKVLIAGGYGATITAPGLNTAELYDPSIGSFTLTTGSMSIGHTGHTATLLTSPATGVLIVGGVASGSGGSAVAEIYNPTSDSFTTTGSLGIGRSFHSAATLANGKVLMSGGWTNYGNASTNQAEVYDPSAGTFSNQGLLAYSRSITGIAVLPNGQVLVVGGIENNSIGSVPAEVYNPGP
jgi:hypothetical protein